MLQLLVPATSTESATEELHDMPVWDEQVARIVWKGQSFLKSLRQKPMVPVSSNSTQFIQNCLRCVRCVRLWFVTCVVPEKPGPVSIPKLKVCDCPIMHNCTFYQANYTPWKAPKFSNGSLSPGKYRITWAPKATKATYVTPYPPKNKYSFLGILSLCLLALFGLLGFWCPDPGPRSEEALCGDTPLPRQTVEVCQGRTCEQAM